VGSDGPKKSYMLYGVHIPRWKGQFLGKRAPIVKYRDFLSRAVHQTWSVDRFAVWVVDSGGPKEAQVQSYSPGGANVPSHVDTLAPSGEYD